MFRFADFEMAVGPDLWYTQNLWVLQETLNAAAQLLNLPLYTPDLDDRFLNMSRGHVDREKNCNCHPTNFNVFEPPDGTICSWATLVTLASGIRDMREIDGCFLHSQFECHNAQNMLHANTVIGAFCQITNVSRVVSNYYTTTVFNELQMSFCISR